MKGKGFTSNGDSWGSDGRNPPPNGNRASLLKSKILAFTSGQTLRTAPLLGYDAPVSLSLQIKECALQVGFDLAGIAPLEAWRDLEFSREWVERGYAGEMRYLENPKRDDPRLVLPGARSVICVGQIYNAPLPYSTETVTWDSGLGTRVKGQRTADEGPRGWISRYAWGRDYHETLRARLEELRGAIEALVPGKETRVYVDTGPVNERAFARLSGIGWTGKNTCLINQQKGSWFFLGVVLTNLALEPDLPAADRCGSCTRCIEACPTDALVEPYVMNASRCIAYLNIELRGSIPEEFRAAIGSNVFGCDICQDVCPWNGNQKSEVRSQNQEAGRRTAATTNMREFQPLQVAIAAEASGLESRTPSPESRIPNPGPRTFSLFNPRLQDLADISEADFKRTFRDSPIKRAKYIGWLRNLCVVMGNSGDERFVPKLRELAAHADPVIREHAEWALGRIAALRTP